MGIELRSAGVLPGGSAIKGTAYSTPTAISVVDLNISLGISTIHHRCFSWMLIWSGGQQTSGESECGIGDPPQPISRGANRLAPTIQPASSSIPLVIAQGPPQQRQHPPHGKTRSNQPRSTQAPATIQPPPPSPVFALDGTMGPRWSRPFCDELHASGTALLPFTQFVVVTSCIPARTTLPTQPNAVPPFQPAAPTPRLAPGIPIPRSDLPKVPEVLDSGCTSHCQQPDMLSTPASSAVRYLRTNCLMRIYRCHNKSFTFNASWTTTLGPHPCKRLP